MTSTPSWPNQKADELTEEEWRQVAESACIAWAEEREAEMEAFIFGPDEGTAG
jgi:hypothetical protein